MAVSIPLRRCAALLAATLACGGEQRGAAAQTRPDSAAPEVVISGDWTLRCGVGPAGDRACEIGSTIKRPGQKDPVAQIAIGWQIAAAPAAPQDPKAAKDPKASKDAKAAAAPVAPVDKPAAPMKLIALIPVNVTIAPGVEFVADPAAPPLMLPIKACVQAACVAEAPLTDEQIKAMRGRAVPGRLTFTDPAERPVSVEVSFEGFDKALDMLAKK